MNAAPFGPYNATVAHVHDGDTIALIIALGFDVSVTKPVRIYGINAPELFRGSPESRAKGAAARDFLAAILPPGSRVVLRTTKDQAESFTRYIGTVTSELGDVASAMVTAGHAVWCDADLKPLPGPPRPIGG